MRTHSNRLAVVLATGAGGLFLGLAAITAAPENKPKAVRSPLA